MSEIRYGFGSRNDAPQLLRCVVVAMMSLLLLSGCQRYQDVPQCSEAISEGFTGYFKLDDNGLAVDQVTGTTWYRCSAGQRYQGGQCVGRPLLLGLADAHAYAEEFSRASGRKWRLPTQGEMATVGVGCTSHEAIGAAGFCRPIVANHDVGKHVVID